MRLFDFRALSLLLLLVAQLVLGGAVNRTIDDQEGDSVTGVQVQYSPAGLWSQGSTCGGCATKADPSQAFAGTWHDGSRSPDRDQVPLTFTLQFTGTAIYVYNIASHNILTDVTFTLDGQDAGHFTETFDIPQNMYNVLIFSKDTMPMGDHTLVVSAFGPNYTIVLFDYAIYTTEVNDDVLSTTTSPQFLSPSTTSSTAQTGTSTSPQPQISSSNTPLQNTPSTVHGTLIPTSGIASNDTFITSIIATMTNTATNTVQVEGTSVVVAGGVSSSGGQVSGSDPNNSGGTPQGGTAALTSHHTKVGPIIGGVVGGIVLIVLLALAFFLYRRKRQRSIQVETANPHEAFLEEPKPASLPFHTRFHDETVASQESRSQTRSTNSDLLREQLASLRAEVAALRVADGSGSSSSGQSTSSSSRTDHIVSPLESELQGLRAELAEIRAHQEEKPSIPPDELSSQTPNQEQLLHELALMRTELEELRRQRAYDEESLPRYSAPPGSLRLRPGHTSHGTSTEHLLPASNGPSSQYPYPGSSN